MACDIFCHILKLPPPLPYLISVAAAEDMSLLSRTLLVICRAVLTEPSFIPVNPLCPVNLTSLEGSSYPPNSTKFLIFLPPLISVSPPRKVDRSGE